LFLLSAASIFLQPKTLKGTLNAPPSRVALLLELRYFFFAAFLTAFFAGAFLAAFLVAICLFSLVTICILTAILNAVEECIDSQTNAVKKKTQHKWKNSQQ
jgi:hypothetical protein